MIDHKTTIPHDTKPLREPIKSFCRGNLKMKGRRVEGEKVRGLKASIPFLYPNSNELYNIRHFDAFPAVGGIPSCPQGTNSINN